MGASLISSKDPLDLLEPLLLPLRDLEEERLEGGTRLELPFSEDLLEPFRSRRDLTPELLLDLPFVLEFEELGLL